MEKDKPIQEAYNGELDYLVEDTISQLENLHNNEVVDVSLNSEAEEGTD